MENNDSYVNKVWISKAKLIHKNSAAGHKFFEFVNRFMKNVKSFEFCELNSFFVFLCLIKLRPRTFRSTQI